MSEVKMLLELVKVYPISEIDKRMEIVYTLLGNTRGQKHGTMRLVPKLLVHQILIHSYLNHFKFVKNP